MYSFDSLNEEYVNIYSKNRHTEPSREERETKRALNSGANGDK